MLFNVLKCNQRPPANAQATAFLVIDNWDDFTFKTLYYLIYVDKNGEKHNIGNVKIGQFGMEHGKPAIPVRFNKLSKDFFSLGQDESYYENLNALGTEVRGEILNGLVDLSINLELFDRALKEDVTGTSLLRDVTKATVRGQFNRIANGGARLSEYDFSYTLSSASGHDPSPITMDFRVEPESNPPTNIHVLIGRNGVGKTHLLNHMTKALVQKNKTLDTVGQFVYDKKKLEYELFSNIVSITFSAFDRFEPLTEPKNKSSGIRYSYVGLKHTSQSQNEKPRPPKNHEDLRTEFGESAQICCKGARAKRWRRALEMLEADPIFKSADVARLSSLNGEEIRKQGSNLFGNLSSGHKIVLLTTTRLVETVEERTLVMLDEPEAHLHPPLLSAFIRALSDLLINRNGVAIVATHSPVVLQEVPKSCVWKIRRSGRKVVVERPQLETFGENVGVLTREVFGLEVTHSGFHTLIKKCLERHDNFDDILDNFSGELGAEGKAIVRALLATREGNNLT
jgi:predicted ATPase